MRPRDHKPRIVKSQVGPWWMCWPPFKWAERPAGLMAGLGDTPAQAYENYIRDNKDKL